MSTLQEILDRQLAKGKDENSFVVKNLRRQIEAEKSGKGFEKSSTVIPSSSYSIGIKSAPPPLFIAIRLILPPRISVLVFLFLT